MHGNANGNPFSFYSALKEWRKGHGPGKLTFAQIQASMVEFQLAKLRK